MLRFFVYFILVIAFAFIPFKMDHEKSVQVYKHSAVRVSLSEMQKPHEKPKPQIKKVQPKPKPKPKKVIKKKPKQKKVPKPRVQKTPQKTEPPKKQEIKEPVAVAQVVTGATQQSKIQDIKENYYSLIYARIDAQKRYPKKALRFKQQGVVRVAFVVQNEGRITNFKILEASEFEALNKEVKRIFKRLRELDKPPDTIKTPLKVHLSIRFQLDEE